MEKEVPPPEKKPVPLPDERGLYKQPDVATLKMRSVENRRKNEDRVPSYFIEDEDY
jgi:hypothetical protein